MVVGGPAYGESSKVINFSPANETCIMHMQEKKKRKINKPENNNNGGDFFLTLMHPRGCVCVVHCRAPPSLNEDHGGVGHVLGGGGGFICTVLDAQTKIFSLLPKLPPPLLQNRQPHLFSANGRHNYSLDILYKNMFLV